MNLTIVSTIEKLAIFSHKHMVREINNHYSTREIEKNKLVKLIEDLKSNSEGLIDNQEKTWQYKLIDISVYQNKGLLITPYYLNQKNSQSLDSISLDGEIPTKKGYNQVLGYSFIHVLPDGQLIEATFIDNFFVPEMDLIPLFNAIKALRLEHKLQHDLPINIDKKHKHKI